MDTSFLEKLRLNNIFGGQTPFGMPNMDSGRLDPMGIANTARNWFLEDREHREREVNRDKLSQNGLKSIGQSMNPQGPANHVVGPSSVNPIDAFEGISPWQKAQLENKREVAGLKGDLAYAGLDIKSRGMDINQQKANIMDFKAKNPGLKWEAVKGGNIFTFNPITGERKDTGISSGSLSDADKIELTGEQRLNQIDAQGRNQMNVQGLRGEQGQALQGVKGNQNLAAIAANIAGKKELVGMKSDKPMLPTQERVKQNNAARQLLNSHPEYAEYIKQSENGDFSVMPPSQGYFGANGPSKEMYDMINQSIYGGGKDIELKKESPKTPKTPVTPTAPVSKYKVTIK